MLVALAHLDTKALPQCLLWVLTLELCRLMVGVLGDCDNPTRTPHQVLKGLVHRGKWRLYKQSGGHFPTQKVLLPKYILLFLCGWVPTITPHLFCLLSGHFFFF